MNKKQTFLSDYAHWVLILITLVYFAACGIALSGCYTPNKAAKQLDHAIDKYPKIAAQRTRAHFPCTTTNADTLVLTKDSLVWVDCPDPVQPTDYFHDTITLTKLVKSESVKTIKVPVQLPVKYITITKKVEDSAKIFILTAEADRLKAYSAKMEAKVVKKNWIIKWLIIALIVSILLNYFQFKGGVKLIKNL